MVIIIAKLYYYYQYYYYYSAWGGSFSCCEYLINECKLPVSVNNNDNMIPLQFATAGNHTEIVHLLLSNNNINDNNNSDSSLSGLTSLHRACQYGSLEVL